jgi:hypothetical protein
MEDYGFEYSDDEPEEQDVDIENQYYNSKGSGPPPLLLASRSVGMYTLFNFPDRGSVPL